VTVEIDSPRFRIYFWRLADHAFREFEADGADVDDVLAWAESERRPDETYTLHLVSILGDDVVLTRLAGATQARTIAGVHVDML
jgi:hypothetical protein